MQLKQWGAGALLTLALLSFVTTIILYRISMLGVEKVFGHFSGSTGIALLFLFGIVALVNLFSIPATLLLGVVLLIKSARKNQFASFCAAFACLISIANLLFWLFYCGGIPGTAQRPFSLIHLLYQRQISVESASPKGFFAAIAFIRSTPCTTSSSRNLQSSQAHSEYTHGMRVGFIYFPNSRLS